MLRAAVIEALTGVLGESAEQAGDLGQFLSDPPNPELGDIAFGCFGLARILRRSPAQIAEDLAASWQPGGLFRSAEAVGPYLNLRADPVALLEATCRAVADGSLWAPGRTQVPQRMMIEFSQPNTHKVFHVGHLRNVVLGDSLVRIHRARGHEVIAANYYGDFGIDVAKCLWWLQTHPEEIAPDTHRTAWLGKAYLLANEALRVKDGKEEGEVADDPDTVALKQERLAEVREVLHAMESQEPGVWAQYQQTRAWCLEEFADTYRWLDVSFDVDFFESQVEDASRALVDAFLERGVFELSDGAVVCDLRPELDVPALLRKSDGTSLYLTWDLGLAERKFSEFDIERSLYVVGSEQRFHFRQLFATLERMGYERAADCEHVAYELVVLPEGKMSSRRGTAIPLHELRTQVSAAIEVHIQAAEAEGTSRIPEGLRGETIHRLAAASLRYGMLRIGTNKRVVFDIEGWTNPRGETGVYLLYAVARLRSIQRRAGGAPALDVALPTDAGFGEALEERALLTHLLKAPVVLERSADSNDPSAIAGWLYEGSRLVSRFFHECQVIKAQPGLRRARLALVRAADEAMTEGLRLLGITAVDQM